MAGLQQIADERWRSHRDAHRDLAEALREYKQAASEWRGTLSELRTGGVTRTEYAADYRALEQRLEAATAALEVRIDALQRIVEQTNTERMATRALVGSIRNLVLLGFTILGGVIAVLVYLRI